VPVWYAYEPGGEIRLWTGGRSAKRKLLERRGRFSLCVQCETPPYRYASVEGAVVGIEAADYERDVCALAYRYLGHEGGDRYLEELGGPNAVADDVLIRLAPERWFSEDFSKA